MGSGTSGLVWVDCHDPAEAFRLQQILETEGYEVYRGRQPPVQASPSLVIYGPDVDEAAEVASEVRRLDAEAPGAPALVFGLSAELPLARAALRAGARGFIHALMPPEQVVRALEVASKGEAVIPRELTKALLEVEAQVDPDVLTPRQREVLELVAEDLSNAQIARRLFLTEFTVKQHLSKAYRRLGVRNRNQATSVLRKRQRRGPSFQSHAARQEYAADRQLAADKRLEAEGPFSR
jgi:DNA-binding NarL/FixJ family response regulator